MRAEKEKEKLPLGEEGLGACGQSQGSGAALPSPTPPRGLAHRPALTGYTKPNVLVDVKLDLGHDGCVYTTGMGKRHGSGYPQPSC